MKTIRPCVIYIGYGNPIKQRKRKNNRKWINKHTFYFEKISSSFSEIPDLAQSITIEYNHNF